MRQRSLSADISRPGLIGQAVAGSPGLASRRSADGFGLQVADPAAVMLQILASQQQVQLQGLDQQQQQQQQMVQLEALHNQQMQNIWLQARNPFRQQEGVTATSAASAPVLRQHSLGPVPLPQGLATNLSDPGVMRQAAGGSGELPRPQSMPRMASSVSEASTSQVTTLTSDSSRGSASMPWQPQHVRNASDRSDSGGNPMLGQGALLAEGGGLEVASTLGSETVSGSGSSALSGPPPLDIPDAGSEMGGPAVAAVDPLGGQECVWHMQDIAAR